MRVLIVGDLHGQHRLLAEILQQACPVFRIGAAIQVGDFGFYEDWLREARFERLRFPVPVHAIDGNHEDHRWLERALHSGEAERWRRELNLIYQPRPSLAQLGSGKVGFLGGALHVDRPQKLNWRGGLANYISPQQREEAACLFNQAQPDLIVTHSCPSQIGIGMRCAEEMRSGVEAHITAAGFNAGPEDDCGELQLYHLWLELEYRPAAWVFGHFHRDHQACIDGTQFVGVGEDLVSPGRSLVIWDTEEKAILRCPWDPSLESHK